MPCNADRAEWARVALEAFAKQTNQDRNGDLEHDPASVISDLICDLMHLAYEMELPIPEILSNANGNFEEEIEFDDDDEEYEEG